MKNKAPVGLVENVSLEPFCATTSGGDYHLRSLVHHIGARPSSGHYLADSIRPFRATSTDSVADKPAESSSLTAPTTEDSTATETAPPEEEWITFDDANSCKTTLSKIQENRKKQETAYMLLYSLDP